MTVRTGSSTALRIACIIARFISDERIASSTASVRDLKFTCLHEKAPSLVQTQYTLSMACFTFFDFCIMLFLVPSVPFVKHSTSVKPNALVTGHVSPFFSDNTFRRMPLVLLCALPSTVFTSPCFNHQRNPSRAAVHLGNVKRKVSCLRDTCTSALKRNTSIASFTD